MPRAASERAELVPRAIVWKQHHREVVRGVDVTIGREGHLDPRHAIQFRAVASDDARTCRVLLQ